MPRVASAFRFTAFALFFAGMGAAGLHFGKPTFLGWQARWIARGEATSRPTTAPSQSSLDTWIVKRGDLRITFTENGKLRAVNSYPLIPSIPGQMKITFLAPEGTSVKKGETVASFDKKSFEENLEKAQGDLEDARRQQTVAESALEIARSAAKTNVAAAITKFEDAKVALKTYTEMEGPKRLGELDKLLSENRTKLTEARKAIAEAQRQLDDGVFSEDEQKKALQRDLDDKKSLAQSLERTEASTTLQRKIFRAYEYPQSLKAKKQAVEGATLEVERAKVAGENEVNQKTAEVAKVGDLIKRVERRINDMKDAIEKCDLKAPIDGLVVYGDPANARYYGRPIQVGSEWYGGQVLMTIPDLSSFKIDLNLGETLMGKVKPGIPCAVTFDAVPALSISGKVESIAKLGKPREEYDPSGPRVFPTTIELNSSDPRLVSGMTSKVEILADTVTDALLVPVDGIATENGKTFVLVRVKTGTEKREVKTGRSNNSLVEILEGLSDGESLALGAALTISH